MYMKQQYMLSKTNAVLQTNHLNVGTILASIINNLTLAEQLELLERVLTYFVNQDIMDPSVLEKCGMSALTEHSRHLLEHA